ncbi:MAG: pyridoxamine 5'-phosphate oxidase family protein [Cyanobacteria bacterium P01_G01_bin.54]
MNLDQAQAQYRDFVPSFQSLILGTTTAEGQPNTSYAPFICDAQWNFYCFVSGLAVHTQNLHANPQATVLLIEDEAKSNNIFARRRLSYDCTVSWLERETLDWEAIADQFQTQFGEIVGLLRGLGDFQIVCLTPRSGRFVVGFSAAYQIQGNDLSQLVPLSKPM